MQPVSADERKGCISTSAWPIAITLPNDPDRLSELRATIRQWLTELGISERERAAILLATHEAAANAVEHGDGENSVVVRARAAEAAVVIEVHDQGTWKPRLSEDEERGRGLMLISGLMHEVEISSDDRGTTVRLVHRLTGDDQGPHTART